MGARSSFLARGLAPAPRGQGRHPCLPNQKKNCRALSDIAAAGWARKRDAKREELKRLAGGGGGLPSQMPQALDRLATACAQAGFSGQPLGPAEQEALAKLDSFAAPFPAFSTALRHLAAGQIPTVPTTLPAELQHLLTAILTTIRQAQPGQQP